MINPKVILKLVCYLYDSNHSYDTRYPYILPNPYPMCLVRITTQKAWRNLCCTFFVNMHFALEDMIRWPEYVSPSWGMLSLHTKEIMRPCRWQLCTKNSILCAHCLFTQLFHLTVLSPAADTEFWHNWLHKTTKWTLSILFSEMRLIKTTEEITVTEKRHFFGNVANLSKIPI